MVNKDALQQVKGHLMTDTENSRHRTIRNTERITFWFSLIAAFDEVTAPDHVLRAVQHALAAVEQELGEAGQRVLHQEAQRVLQAVTHLRHEAAHLGHAVYLPARLLQAEPAGAHIPQAGPDAVAQDGHPRVMQEQLDLHITRGATSPEKNTTCKYYTENYELQSTCQQRFVLINR